MIQHSVNRNWTWDILESKYLLHEPWCTVRCEKIRLPHGAIIPTYYVFEYPTWINTLAITKNGEYLMVQQYRHGIGKVCMELCAGVCDPEDKSPMDAAKRELLEETGYGNGDWSEFLVVSANPGTHNNLCYTFLALNVEKIAESTLENTEDLETHLLSYEELCQLLDQGVIYQSLHAAALWKWRALQGQTPRDQA